MKAWPMARIRYIWELLIATYNNRKSMCILKLDSKMSNCTEDLPVSNVRSSILKLHFCDSKYDTIIYNWTAIWLSYDFTNNEYVTGLLTLVHWRVLLVEQELFNSLDYLRSPPGFRGSHCQTWIFLCSVNHPLFFFFWSLCCLSLFDS